MVCDLDRALSSEGLMLALMLYCHHLEVLNKVSHIFIVHQASQIMCLWNTPRNRV